MYNPDTVEKMKNYANDPANNPEYEVLNGTMYYYGHSDWTDLMLKKYTPSHRHNINISGGNEKTKFYTSVGYVNQSGMYKVGEDSYQRLNTRLSVDNQTTPWMKLGAKVLYNYTTTDKPHKYKDDVMHGIRNLTYMPVYISMTRILFLCWNKEVVTRRKYMISG